MISPVFPLLALAAASGLAPTSPPGGRIITETIHSRALRGNLIGDTPDREVTIHLPPAYERDPSRRFPVLYLLHGRTSHPREWLDGFYQGMDLRVSIDTLVGTGMQEYIVVMPFADNSYGGLFYVNSVAFGRWEDFIALELVRFIEERFRTRPGPESRGLAGQSMGGFGALYLSGRHPDTFGHVYAMSPCCLGFVGELAPDSGLWTNAEVSDAVASKAGWARSMAAAFAPEQRRGSATISAPAPFVVDTDGRVREVEPIANAWRSYLPLERLARNARPYRRLDTIAVEFGHEDQIPSVGAGARAFAGELKRAGIPLTFEEYTGGHIDRVRERFETRLLPFFGRVFSERDDGR